MELGEKMEFLQSIDLENIAFEIKIADFGFSKQLNRQNDKSGTLCGTPLYMAPQIINLKKYSYKADIWSIGIILFELINSRTPFHANSQKEFLKKINSGKYNFLA